MNADGFELMERLETAERDRRATLIDRINRCAAYARAERRAEMIAIEIARQKAEDEAKKRRR